MDHPVSCTLRDGIARIALDDGKVNALSISTLGALRAAMERAEREADVVMLSGRDGVFSAGFDLAVLKGGGDAAYAMVRAGFELAEQVLASPRPVVIACTGHAVAMGAFLLLSGDYRIGADGPFRITANEVAIGLTMPRAAVEVLRQRLTPAHFNRAALLAEPYAPADAVAAGFLDRVVEPEQLPQAASDVAQALRGLDLRAHAATKQRARAATLAALRAAIAEDAAEYERALRAV
ncbi:MAG TPA: crotonase/enoyl-CoA hydratase family protein [Dehalococcoidia bacterium]|nr:crotonase/enoyl-CoA hydratase family protein [Dehalococcoidia bacterium]